MEQTYDAVLFDLFGTLVDDEGGAVDGAAALLEKLDAVRWAVVTSCPRRMAEAMIARAGLPQPPVMVTSEDVLDGKPAPDCYLLAAQRCGVEPSRCVAIEDSRGGVQAALAAGMDAVAVTKNRRGTFPPAAYEIASLGRLQIDAIAGRVRVNV